MNTKLLRRIQKQILKEPRQFDMIGLFNTTLPWKIPNCGTAACIAGWALCLSKHVTPEIADRSGLATLINAQRLLRLRQSEATRLFFLEGWPEKFQGGKSPKTSQAKALAGWRMLALWWMQEPKRIRRNNCWRKVWESGAVAPMALGGCQWTHAEAACVRSSLSQSRLLQPISY